MAPIDSLPSADETLPGDLGETMAAGASESRADAEFLESGSRVGRYEILDVLGHGGMGVVYEAFDPQLERKVALKLLRLTSGSTEGTSKSTRGSQRLLREAKAMAKLRHPNVLTVYDAGTHEGQVFVVMELVAGGTLGDWLATRPDPEAILEVFRAAGRGLAAAHAEGMVHRDFKPDNVMMGEGGRPLVTDFGLARAFGPGVRVDDPEQPLPEDTDSVDVRLTRTGAAVGTPAYMAPEQHMGELTNAATDQFAFGVALYEAIYGRRPFSGKTLGALAMNVVAGKLDEPKHDPERVSERVHEAILRALRPGADERFENMQALLAELEPQVAKRGGWLWAGGAAAGLVIAALAWQGTRGPDCETRAARLVEGVDDARLDGIRESIAALPAMGAQLSTAVDGALREHRGELSRVAQGLCEARLEGGVSEALLDRQQACVDAHAAELQRTADLLGATPVSTEVLSSALSVVDGLAGVERCRSDAMLNEALALPEDPRVAAEVARLRGELASARVDFRAGRYDQGLAALEGVRAEIDATGYDPLQAETRLLEGLLFERAARYDEGAKALEAAFFAAMSLKYAQVAVPAAAELVALESHDRGNHEAGLTWAKQAEAALAWVAGDDAARAHLETKLGIAAVDRGELEAARDHHQRALELHRQGGESSRQQAAESLMNLGAVHYRLGEYQTALDEQLEAKAELEARLGSEHPKVGLAWHNAGAAYYGLGKLDEAQAAYASARAAFERSLGTTHPKLGDTLNNLGLVLRKRKQYEEAIEVQQAAIEAFVATQGPEHSRVAAAMNNLGNTYYTQGKLDAAIEQFERALEIRRKGLGDDHLDVAYCHQNLGNARWMKGELGPAATHYQKAVDIRAAKLDAQHPRLALSRANLGGLLCELERWDACEEQLRLALEAREGKLPAGHPDITRSRMALAAAYEGRGALDQASALIAQVETGMDTAAEHFDETDRAEFEFLRVRVEWAQGRPKKALLQRARAAQAVFAGGGDTLARMADKVAAWIAARE